MVVPDTAAMRVEQDGVELAVLADLLQRRGRVRGEPVAISLFREEIPEPYEGRRVEPCAIVRHAMDLGETVYVDAEHHDCLAGAWQAGFVDPPEPIRTGSYLSDGIPGMLPIAAARVKTGVNVLPQGLFRAIGATPLSRVPADVTVDLVVVVCEPVYASTIAGVRTALDGTPPRGAAGSSLCGELFAVPFHEPNVIMTPGDMGGRMFNKIKPHEMFVIIPFEWVHHLPNVLDETPDVPALMESIKPGFIEEREQRLATRKQRAAARADAGANEAPVQRDVDAATVSVPDLTMPWDDDALELLAQAPDPIREFAGPTLEEWALEHGHERITLEVMAAQMESIGMRLEDVMALAEEGEQ